MAIFGDQGTHLGWYGITDVLRGEGHNMGAIDGVAVSMSAYTRLSLGGGASTYKLKMAIYDMSANLIGVTDEIVSTGAAAQWSLAPFSAPKPPLSAGVRYALVVISATALAQVAGIGVIKPPYYGKTDAIDYDDFPEDPATWSIDNHGYSIYCTYTKIPYVHHLGKGTMYTP